MPIECLLDLTPSPPTPDSLYESLTFPAPPHSRPYVVINMASTVDGKIVLGDPAGSAAGVGGPTDQRLFRRVQRNVDGALIGGRTLRASQVIYPAEIARFAATRSGDLPLDNRFFRDAPDRAYIVAPEDIPDATRDRLAARAQLVQTGHGEVDWPAAFLHLRQRLGIRALLCEGGSEINDQLIRAGAVDELFLTVAPKLKGGSHTPTIVGGQGFASGLALPLNLISVYHDGDELYLRYYMAKDATRLTHRKT